MFTTLDLNSGGAGRPHPKKRAQVRRACDRCRMMRIKCDNDRPCYQCREARCECGISASRKSQFRSLASAVQEVEALRAQLRERENLEMEKSGGDASKTSSPATMANVSPGISVSSSEHPPTAEQLSPSFFLPRMRQHLQKTRPQGIADLLAGLRHGIYSLPPSPSPSDEAVYLSPDREAHALTLFWKSHFFTFPFLNESQFWTQYRALIAEAETDPVSQRKASPLIDIVLALCLQWASYACGWVDGLHISEAHRPSLAGLQYFRRCQEVLDQNMDSPTIVTVQCYVFSVIYLCEAGCLSRAQEVLGKGIRLASMLGLQHESQTGGSDHEKEVKRRTWWALYAIDSRLSQETGRPPKIQPGTSTCSPPSDSLEFAEWLAPLYHHNPACPLWLGFQTHMLGMLRVVGDTRVFLNATYAKAVGDAGHDAFIRDGAAREECARCLADGMERVYAWGRQVPKGYFVPRKEGQPFCTDRSVLDLSVNPNILVHCQTQRLLIELHFHFQCMSLYQSFICFSSPPGTSTPVADGIAAAAAHHAKALTCMMHQALTASEALSGVYHIFRYQKAALLIMLGYAYSFPLSPLRTTIRDSINMAISVVEMYGRVIPEATSFAEMARALADDVGALVDNFLGGVRGVRGSSRALPSSASQTPGGLAQVDAPPGPSSTASLSIAHQDLSAMTTEGTPTSAVSWPSDLATLHMEGNDSNEASFMDAQWFSMTDDSNPGFWDDVILGDHTQW